MKEQWTIRIAAILMLIIGFMIRYTVARRKFNRRAMTGAEGFRSFERAWSITFGERVARRIGTFLIIIGILLLVSTIVNFRSIYELGK
jgi:hypothetical protein